MKENKLSNIYGLVKAIQQNLSMDEPLDKRIWKGSVSAANIKRSLTNFRKFLERSVEHGALNPNGREE